MPGGVEAVGTDEMRVVEPELPRPSVHHRDEAAHVAAPHVLCEGPGCVVRALDEGGLDEVADGELPPARRFTLDSPTAAA